MNSLQINFSKINLQILSKETKSFIYFLEKYFYTLILVYVVSYNVKTKNLFLNII